MIPENSEIANSQTPKPMTDPHYIHLIMKGITFLCCCVVFAIGIVTISNGISIDSTKEMIIGGGMMAVSLGIAVYLTVKEEDKYDL